MAAALRLAAKRFCGGALEQPPQAFLTATKDLAARRAANGGSSLRRPFSSSESASQNLLNNKPCTGTTEPTASLSAQVEQKKHELLGLLRQIDKNPGAAMADEHKELQRLIGTSTNRFKLLLWKVSVVAIVAGKATALLGYDYVLRRRDKRDAADAQAHREHYERVFGCSTAGSL